MIGNVPEKFESDVNGERELRKAWVSKSGPRKEKKGVGMEGPIQVTLAGPGGQY